MNPKELMLGDYIQNTNGNIGVVIGYKDSEVIMRYAPNSTCFSDPNILRPIPLTPEILEKNGFTHYGESELLDAFCWVEFNEARNGCMINRASIKVTLYKKPIMGVSVLMEIDTYSTKGDGVNKVHSCDIESVHELQHALRLCGIEKEIVL